MVTMVTLALYLRVCNADLVLISLSIQHVMHKVKLTFSRHVAELTNSLHNMSVTKAVGNCIQNSFHGVDKGIMINSVTCIVEGSLNSLYNVAMILYI